MGALDFKLPVADLFRSDSVDTVFDRQLSNTLWITMNENSAATHNFTLPLLHALQDIFSTLKSTSSHWLNNGELSPVQYLVMKSAHPKYFNLGGDLSHFRSCIQKQDKKGLYNYAKLCLDILTRWSSGSAQSMTTIALVQGKALGGGFEAALGADYLIAEEQSTFGFPEIMFGLFPCTGGMGLLARRIGVYQAEKMMTSPRIYTAAELKDMGLVDEVCAPGTGNLAVEKFVTEHAGKRPARMMLQKARDRMAPLDYAEMQTVVNEWVELAMALPASELKVMDMLIKMQGSAVEHRSVAIETLKQG